MYIKKQFFQYCVQILDCLFYTFWCVRVHEISAVYRLGSLFLVQFVFLGDG